MRRDHADSNAAELYANLQKSGWSIQRITSAIQRAAGVPDAIVARKGDPTHRTHLLEVKALGGRLSQAQIDFARTWPGCTHTATNSWEANELLKMCEVMLRQKP